MDDDDELRVVDNDIETDVKPKQSERVPSYGDLKMLEQARIRDGSKKSKFLPQVRCNCDGNGGCEIF